MATDLFEMSGAYRQGSITLSNVEMSYCSQRSTYKSCVRFESATGYSSVTDSTFYDSEGWSASIYKASNVIMQNNVFLGAKAVGVHMDMVRNVTFSDNFVGDVMKRKFTAIDKVVDKESCVVICSYMSEGSRCTDLTITNNIAAGCEFGGFVAPGNDCGDASSNKFRDNVSHSNNGAGAYIYPDKYSATQGTCYEGSAFSAYKTTLPCVVTHYPSREIRMHGMTCIDNVKGISLQTGGIDADKLKIDFKHSYIYGETEADDCPQGHECWCQEKTGFLFFGNNLKSKDLHPTMASSLPVHKVKSEGAWGGDINIYNVHFSGFLTGKTKCLAKHRLFGRSKEASDKIPIHKFVACSFSNVDEISMAYFKDPTAGWANSSDCGDFPCTAPNNVVLSFSSTLWSGITMPGATQSFQLIGAGGPNVAGKYENCSDRMLSWNGYYCMNRKIGLLMFENLDEDKWDRTFSPVYIRNEATGFENVLNSMMDHVWDGFYTGQLRLTRFPG